MAKPFLWWRMGVFCQAARIAVSIALTVAKAGPGSDMSMRRGTTDSRGLIRTRMAPRSINAAWLKFLTDGIAVPAPSSTTTIREAPSNQ